jgi:predicted ferric reductase
MTAILEAPGSTTSRRRRHMLRRGPARRRPAAVDVLAGLGGLGLGVSIGFGLNVETMTSVSTIAGAATAGGRLAGLISAYVIVMIVLLAARIPPLERAIGQDRLIAWHRRLGPWGLYLLLAHVGLITFGYARTARTGVVHEFVQLTLTFSWMLPAVVGTALLFLAGIVSYHRLRRRLAHETWWSIHLYLYLGLFLAFFHQIETGASFVGHPFARLWWIGLWGGTLAAMIAFRVALPLLRSFRHRLRVVAVEPAGEAMWSITMEGRRLNRLPIGGGQFMQWRFLSPGLWWQAHPYSISATPDDRHLRITVKLIGDHSTALADIPLGTRVAFEGPYGVFTSDASRSDKVLLIGAGVGGTPIRAMLDDLPYRTDVVVILRGSTVDDLVHRDEFHHLIDRRQGRLYELIGSRHEVRLDSEDLYSFIPDIADRDVYICGPDPFTDSVVAAAAGAGVPDGSIHRETFSF